MRPDLLKAAHEVDVLDVAGTILAAPDRAMVSTAAKVALASAVEKCWAVCLEADLLVRALALPVTGDPARDGARQAAIDLQAAEVARLFGNITEQVPAPTEEETEDGNH